MNKYLATITWRPEGGVWQLAQITGWYDPFYFFNMGDIYAYFKQFASRFYIDETLVEDVTTGRIITWSRSQVRPIPEEGVTYLG